MDRIESDPTPAGEPIDSVPPAQEDVGEQRPPADPPPLDEEAAPPIPPPPSRRQINPVLELALILLAALGLWWVANGWIVKPYRIPSASMEPTLRDGDRVLVARFVYHFHDPRRGDIIVFHPPGAGDQAIRNAKTEASVYFIKRIVGLPGETVEGRNHHILICKAPRVGCHVLNEPYLTQAAVSTPFPPVTVPAGQYFMMGDNRVVSDDSRTWGTLPRAYIIGEAFATYWPPDRLRTL
ncbi:MAG: signal peptidase [Gaiellales bacterium]|nr:signal peptidase [Gaiellales bacterium]